MGSPIPLNGKCFAAFSTHKWLGTMLSFVMGLKGPEVLQWFSSWMVDVVLAPLCTAVAW
jgi:hypothetical protein